MPTPGSLAAGRPIRNDSPRCSRPSFARGGSVRARRAAGPCSQSRGKARGVREEPWEQLCEAGCGGRTFSGRGATSSDRSAGDALPRLPRSAARIVTARDDSRKGRSQTLMISARHRRFDPLTYGSGVWNPGLASSGSGLQTIGKKGLQTGSPVHPVQGVAPNSRSFAAYVLQQKEPAGPTKTRAPAPSGRLLSVREAAEALGVCTATLYTIVERGELPHVRISNAIRIAPSDLAAFVEARRQRGGGK
jgi:excisionase family DNA binding protein